jgi:hypothetical protein
LHLKLVQGSLVDSGFECSHIYEPKAKGGNDESPFIALIDADDFCLTIELGISNNVNQ